MLHPLAILGLGMSAVVVLIVVFRLNAFIALIASAILVSLLSPGEWAEKIPRVAQAFGNSAGQIGIVIAMAAVIGKCLIDSGAADRIVRAFLRLLGEKRAAAALLSSGFVLAIPVFFDTVFYLLLPLARSLTRRVGGHYLLFLLAIAGGAVIGHTLIPPTPGPLLMAAELKVDLGMMFLLGPMIGVPTAVVTLIACKVIDRRLNLPMRPYAGETLLEPLPDEALPGLGVSLTPILLPIVLISTDTVTSLLADVYQGSPLGDALSVVRRFTAVFGNPNLALILSALFAMAVLIRSRGMSFRELAGVSESALTSAGTIILITAAGGAFGGMLRETGMTETIREMIGGEAAQGVGMIMLCIGFGMAVVLKLALGSGTVVMITTAGMFGAMEVSPEMLGFHPAYLAMAIGSGSSVGSWLNDSGFWLFSRMGGFTELETLKTWTLTLAILGVASFGFTLLFAWLMPFTGV